MKVCLRNEVEIRNLVHFCLLFELRSYLPLVYTKLFWYFKVLFSIFFKDIVSTQKTKPSSGSSAGRSTLVSPDRCKAVVQSQAIFRDFQGWFCFRVFVCLSYILSQRVVLVWCLVFVLFFWTTLCVTEAALDQTVTLSPRLTLNRS